MKWLSLILFVLFLAGGGAWVYSKSRGLRNNNPGNIRRGIDWQGMAERQPDPEFVTFQSPVYGIRAMNKILKTYATKYGLNTVRGIINRWAPPSENDTDAYVAAVAEALGVDPDARIDVAARARELTQAIIQHENGIQPYPLAFVEQGVSMGWA